MVVKIEIEIF